MINESNKKDKKNDTIREQILEWMIETPFIFVLVLFGVSYLVYKFSKVLFYPIQTLDGIVQLVERFRKLSKASPF